jgi:hypothetical protein
MRPISSISRGSKRTGAGILRESRTDGSARSVQSRGTANVPLLDPWSIRVSRLATFRVFSILKD